jgi:hypothetical protein
MSKFVAIPRCYDYYFKLPDGIETLEDKKVEMYIAKNGQLFLKLKGNDEQITIEPTYIEDCAYFNRKGKEYYDQTPTPFPKK